MKQKCQMRALCGLLTVVTFYATSGQVMLDKSITEDYILKNAPKIWHNYITTHLHHLLLNQIVENIKPEHCLSVATQGKVEVVFANTKTKLFSVFRLLFLCTSRFLSFAKATVFQDESSDQHHLKDKTQKARQQNLKLGAFSFDLYDWCREIRTVCFKRKKYISFYSIDKPITHLVSFFYNNQNDPYQTLKMNVTKAFTYHIELPSQLAMNVTINMLFVPFQCHKGSGIVIRFGKRPRKDSMHLCGRFSSMCVFLQDQCSVSQGTNPFGHLDMIFSVFDAKRVRQSETPSKRENHHFVLVWLLVFLHKNKTLSNWHMKVAKDSCIKLNLSAGSNWIFQMFDGPGERSRQIQRSESQLYLARNFQCTIYLWAKTNTVKSKTVLSVFDIHFKKQKVHIGTVKLSISKQLSALQIPNPRLQKSRFFQVVVSASKQAKVNMTIQSLSYKGVQSHSCKYAGLAVFDGLTHNELSTFCENLPSNWNQPQNIHSTGNTIVLISYIYFEYAKLNLLFHFSSSLCKPVHLNFCNYRTGHWLQIPAQQEGTCLLYVVTLNKSKVRSCKYMFYPSDDDVRYNIKGFFTVFKHSKDPGKAGKLKRAPKISFQVVFHPSTANKSMSSNVMIVFNFFLQLFIFHPTQDMTRCIFGAKTAKYGFGKHHSPMLPMKWDLLTTEAKIVL